VIVGRPGSLVRLRSPCARRRKSSRSRIRSGSCVLPAAHESRGEQCRRATAGRLYLEYAQVPAPTLVNAKSQTGCSPCTTLPRSQVSLVKTIAGDGAVAAAGRRNDGDRGKQRGERRGAGRFSPNTCRLPVEDPPRRDAHHAGVIAVGNDGEGAGVVDAMEGAVVARVDGEAQVVAPRSSGSASTSSPIDPSPRAQEGAAVNRGVGAVQVPGPRRRRGRSRRPGPRRAARPPAQAHAEALPRAEVESSRRGRCAPRRRRSPPPGCPLRAAGAST